MNDWKNCESVTKRQAIVGGDIAITKLCTSVKGLSYDRLTANKMLDSVKEGQSYPRTILNLLLQATGDLP